MQRTRRAPAGTVWQVVERRAHSKLFRLGGNAETAASSAKAAPARLPERAEAERTRAREALRSHAAQLSQYSGHGAKSSYDTKELLNDLRAGRGYWRSRRQRKRARQRRDMNCTPD